MTSIFDLKTNVSELESANQGISKMVYEQVVPMRDIQGNNFANGQINYRFQCSGQKWWVPSKSYIRTRFRLTKGDGVTPVDLSDGVAPNMGLCANLFQSGEMRINDKTVSRISDFMPQVDALETRLSKSKSWIDSIGASSNWWQESQAIRLNEVSSDGAIIKGEAPTVQREIPTSDDVMGFDPLNSLAYNATTGVVTIAQGGAAAPPLSFVDNFEATDSFVFRGTTSGANLPNGVLNVKLEVIQVIDATQLLVRAAIKDDIAASNDLQFLRLRTEDTESPDSRRIGEFELTWSPPLSLLKVENALPSGRFELVLTPQTASTFQKRAIESILGTASKNPTLANGVAGDYKLTVVDQYLNVLTVEGPRADNVTYYLDLEQTRLQTEKIDNTSFGQKTFDVSPSTCALTVAYQDLRAGENTAISASKFKSYDSNAVPSTSQELGLNRMFIQYAGRQLPQPDSDATFESGQDYTTQRYLETQLYSGAYHDTGGAETIEEWHDRGAYQFYRFPKDGTDRSTRVICHQGFKSGTDVANMRVLLFDHSKQVCRVQVSNGFVTDVQIEDA